MTTQIAIRLPREMVEFLDQLVARGEAKSRAAAVMRALELDRRRRMAEHDAAIYAGSKDRGLDSLAAWAAKNTNLGDLN
jgi:Arc/MetJ-type ribon-helix-helix transcriptional regulator